MAMGRRKDRARTPGLWIAANELPPTGGHPFYQRLNQVLDAHAFDDFVEAQCAPFYATTIGRPSLTPGTYFRLLLIGYFEGIDSERGIAWRAADSLALRDFLGVGLDAAPPDHSTISRTRRLIDVETHRAVFTWVLRSTPSSSRRARLSASRSQGADQGDTTTIQATLPEAAEQLEAVAAVTDNAGAVIDEVAADKGYHSSGPSTISKCSIFGPTSANPTAGRNRGSIKRRNGAPSTPIGDASGVTAANSFSARVANGWNDRAHISTKPADSVA